MHAAGRRGEVTVAPSPAALQPSRAVPSPGPRFRVPHPTPPPGRPSLPTFGSSSVSAVALCSSAVAFHRASLDGFVRFPPSPTPRPAAAAAAAAAVCSLSMNFTARTAEKDRSCVRTYVRTSGRVRDGDVRMCEGTCKAQRLGTRGFVAHVASVVLLRSGGRIRGIYARSAGQAARSRCQWIQPSICARAVLCKRKCTLPRPMIGAKTRGREHLLPIMSPCSAYSGAATTLLMIALLSGCSLDLSRSSVRLLARKACLCVCSFWGLRRSGVRIKLFLRAGNPRPCLVHLEN
jgi:hypothetical protein